MFIKLLFPINFSKILLFFGTISILVFSPLGQANSSNSDSGKTKPPFKVLYSNDTTNIITCESPYHKEGEPMNMTMLDATVDETAGTGVDVHMLQPGFTWVPLWQSEVLPVEEHVEWWNNTYKGVGISDYLKMVLQGNDFISSFVQRCKQHKLVPFVSLRLNDKHSLNEIENPKPGHSLNLSRFYINHPAYQIGDDKNDQYQRVFNWAIPEVREHKFNFIKEICENYDITGLELDFMRHPNFFRLYETTSKQRKKIMTNFIKRVRELLDHTSGKNKHRWLCVRVPAHISTHDITGIDLKGFEKAGVDMFNISAYYFTDQQSDIKQIAEMIPNSAKYLEMTHCSAIGKTMAKGGDNFEFRRTTNEQFYTTAHLAYHYGFDGVSVFNFHYYRKHGVGDRGEFTEPPFNIFKHIDDKEWISRQKQHYFIGKTWNHPRRPYVPMEQSLEDRKYVTYHMDMAPPRGGWSKDARMRIQSNEAWKDQKLIVRFNDTHLYTIPDVSEPYKTSFKSGTGEPTQYRAYKVPKEVLTNGINQITIALVDGKPLDIIYLDIAVE